MNKTFPYHIVENSIWPFLISFQSFLIINQFILLNYKISSILSFVLTLSLVIFTIFLWFKDIINEGLYLGDHTVKVNQGLKLGFYLFLITEIMLFFGVFWGLFHFILSPDVFIGSQWPPVGIAEINCFGLPLLNTVLLLSSASWVTFAHHNLINRKMVIISLFITILLAIFFLLCQFLEYYSSSFTIFDSVYGSVFYISTGLHILHVIFGTIFLFIGLIRYINYHYSVKNHLSLELAIIYWHIVDIIWLFLWVVVYFLN